MLIETSKGKLPIRYGWNALAEFGDLIDMQMDEILMLDPSKLKISQMIVFIFVGLKFGARKAEEECAVASAEEVGYMLDDNVKILGLAVEAFVEFVKNAEEASTPESKKK